MAPLNKLMALVLCTSELRGCQMQGTSEQPHGFHLQLSAAGTSELRVVVKCIAPLNNHVVSIGS